MIQLLAGSPPNPILFQDALTYVNAAAAASAGWTNTGSPGWGNTSGPGSFSGSAALVVATSSNKTLSPSFSGHGGGTIYFYLKEWAVATNANEQTCFTFRNSGTSMFQFRARSSATHAFMIVDSVGGANTTSLNNVYAVNTVYPLKIAYTPGTGADDGVITVWLSLDGTTWTQRVTRPNSNCTGTINEVLVESVTSSSHYSRHMYFSTADYTPAQLAALP